MTTQRIQLRRGTAADWTAVNPVLAAGEPGYETDTGFLKVGNGTAAWAALPYLTTGGTGGPGGPGDGGGGGDASTVRGTVPSDVGLSLLGAVDRATARNAIGMTWANLPDKPVVIGAGVDAAAARDAIGAVDSVYVGQQITNLQTDIGDAGYVTPADLLPVRPFNPLTADYTVTQSSTTVAATGVKRTGLEASKMYRFRLELDYDMATTADLKFRLAGPTGCTIRATGYGPMVGSGTGGGFYGDRLTESASSFMVVGGFSTTATATALGGSPARATVEGTILLGTTTGSIEVYAAQNTSQPLMGAVKASSVFDIVECAPAAA